MIDLPDDAVIVAGLEHWEYDSGEARPVIEEPRLLAYLQEELDPQPDYFLKPPAEKDSRGRQGFSPNATVWKFPEWFVSQKMIFEGRSRKRRLVPKINLERGKHRGDDGNLSPVVPMRFIQSCERGHVDDIDWNAFVHGRSPDEEATCRRPLWVVEKGNSQTLADTYIRCECKVERSLAQASRRSLEAIGKCKGRRPWLGPMSREPCGRPGRLLIRSASNAYFPQLISAISIPSSGGELETLVAKLWDKGLKLVTTGQSLADLRAMIPDIGASLEPYSEAQVEAAIKAHTSGATGDAEKSIKEVEFDALATAKDELGAEVPDGDFYARALDPDLWKDPAKKPWMDAFERIVLVHRLREVVAQVGFTRFEPTHTELSGELDMKVERAPLSRGASWLPATENRGEGIFLKFDKKKIDSWLKRNPVATRGRLLCEGFEAKFHDDEDSRKFYGSAYYMVHSFSHILMNQISLECGYPASSIRERIYAQGEDYGLLLYTGSPDSEGTLGGLVNIARDLAPIIRRALASAELCANDPVCSSQKPDPENQRALLGCACHGCLLVAETSCEQRNELLDRTLVVPTMDERGAAFFEGYAY